METKKSNFLHFYQNNRRKLAGSDPKRGTPHI